MSKHDSSKRGKKERQGADAQPVIPFAGRKKTKRKRRGGILELAFSLWSSWRKTYTLLILLLIAALITLPIAGFYLMQLGSTFSEQKTAFVERVRELQELATAEAYTKVLIERTDNELFGRSIGVNFPGTKRNLLVVIPGSVKAGIDLSKVTEHDMQVDEEEKRIQLTIPKAEFLGGAELYFDKVEVYSVEGLFRGKADIKEGYELANEAKTVLMEEASEQGVLDSAEQNAVKSLKDMFSFAGYRLDIEFKE
ncbi:DUF4230 domain-containing protein [Sporosarcina ureae]|uniref:DUF4230 domain-containing protein n=1 Tax=Sporosarcina ureae TaxID=1571 RepID=UPI000A17E39F|nr:DUF4230 domain-containing protein [Sporosarcina ureae]ARK22158.1 hypothetical protein SporoP32a_11870 [Sporosarcina ureae]